MAFKKGQSGNPGGKWKPGRSGNPAGRPKTKPFKDALKAIIEKVGLEDAAAALVAKANTGDVGAIKELRDTLDGRLPQTVENGEDGPLELVVTWQSKKSK